MSGLPDEKDVATPVVTPDDATRDGKIGETVQVLDDPDVEMKPEDVEVEVVDVRDPEDRREPLKDQASVGKDKDIDKELEDLNAKGAKRIQELKHQVHDQRRLKEAAEREREAAVRYASQVRESLLAERRRAAEIEKIAYEQAMAKAKAELEAAKRDHKLAYESGDADKVADAATRIAKAATDEQRFAYAQPREPEAPPEFRPDPRQNIPDQRAIEWARKNAWFKMEPGSDGRPVPANAESATAYSIHVALVGEGIDPSAPDTKYYQELDRRLRAVYPEKFQASEEDDAQLKPKKPAVRQPAVVAPANRGGPAPKRVQLTQDEVNLAKKLNVPIEEFARHKSMLSS